MIALITFKFHMTIDIIFINYNSSSCTFQRSWLPLKSGHRVVHFVCVKPLTHVPLNVALWHRLSLMDPGFVISVYVCAIRQRQDLLRQHTTAETKADKPRPTQIITFTPTGHDCCITLSAFRLTVYYFRLNLQKCSSRLLWRPVQSNCFTLLGLRRNTSIHISIYRSQLC